MTQHKNTMQQQQQNAQSSSSGSETQTVISYPKYFLNCSVEKGPNYYEYDTPEHFASLQWKSGDIYICEQKIGRGKYSQVFSAYNVQNGSKCVVKMLKPVKQRKITREVKILMILSGHRNVIQMVDLVKQNSIYCLVFQRVRYTQTKRVFFQATPFQAKYYLYQILQGLWHCHSLGIMHRDIKPGNLLIDQDTKTLKILDWGLAQFYVPGRDLNVHVASRYYKPPELLVGYEYYHYSLDIWSFGAVMATTVFKVQPFFKGSDNYDQLQQISKVLGTQELYNYVTKYNIFVESQVEKALNVHQPKPFKSFVNKINQKFADAIAIDLLQKVLVYDHDQRPSAYECMQHEYFNEVRHHFQEVPSSQSKQQIRKFQQKK